jgi:hypothetical protein
MREVFRSNWTTVLLSLVGWLAALAVGYSKFGFAHNVQIGLVGALGYMLWLVRDRYIVYVATEDNRWLISSDERIIPSEFKLDVASILYIARFPHFIVRSWGGRMVIFFRDHDGAIKQIGIPESSYTWETLKAILKKLTSIKSTIEVDPQYKSLLNARDNSIEEDLSQQLPRSANEIEAYVAEKYGPPGNQVASYKVRVLIQIALATGLLFFAGAVLTFK